MTRIVILIVLLIVIQILRKSMSGVKAPPPRITLERSTPQWKDGASVARLAQPLAGLGFREVGTFVVKEMKLGLRAFGHPTEQVYAVVYDKIGNAAPFLDFVSKYEDGTSVTYTNNAYAAAGALDSMPGREKVRAPGEDPSALFRRLIAERPPKPLLTLRPQDFKMLFETAYADEMSWRAGRGGATRDEIRRVADATGRTVSEDEITRAQAEMRRQEEKARGVHPR